MSDKHVLLFDLGGVLVEFTGTEEVRRLYLGSRTEDEVRDMWANSGLMNDFQSGRISADEFGESFVAQWDLTLEPAEFLVAFESWSSRLYPGARELLEGLRPRYRLAALSNSNALHWRRNNEQLGVAALFDHVFSSHEIGVLKPEAGAYRFALRGLGVEPGDITFFDDVAENVTAALDLGMDAHQVAGVDDLRSRLEELRFL